MNGQSFQLYKGSGVLRLTLLPAVFRQKEGTNFLDKIKGKEGVLLEVAPATPNVKQSYEWEKKKIVFKLGEPDINKILGFIQFNQKEVKLVHDPGALTEEAGQVFKYVKITRLDGGNFMAEVSVKEKALVADPAPPVKVAIGANEMLTIRILLTHALPYILGWYHPPIVWR